MPRPVAILASLEQATGNNATAERISNFIRVTNQETILVNVNDFNNEQELSQWHERVQPLIYIAIHAYRAGQMLYQIPTCKYILIFGGTDLNQHVHVPSKLQIMLKACRNALHLIAFSEKMKNNALKVRSAVMLFKFPF